MSVSKWAYDPDKCDGKACIGECDLCHLAEDPGDGLMEQISDGTASPSTTCGYPDCDKCGKYVTLHGSRYCTVPIVVTKQLWLDLVGEKRFERDRINLQLERLKLEVSMLKEKVNEILGFQCEQSDR